MSNFQTVFAFITVISMILGLSEKVTSKIWRNKSCL